MSTPRTIVLLSSALLSGSAFSEEMTEPHWTYSGPSGPEWWGELSPQFTACTKGQNQSPVDIGATFKTDLPPLEFDYNSKATEVLHNGHSIQVNFAPGSTLRLSGREFALKQFHVHAPSEHLVLSRSFPMEGHLVHADAEGHLAVVALLYNVGQSNRALANFWNPVPVKAGEKQKIANGLTAAHLLPTKWHYYLLSGSLTTPPCSEGVWWVVLKTPSQLSQQQLSAMRKAVGFANNRPVQPLHARPVLQ